MAPDPDPELAAFADSLRRGRIFALHIVAFAIAAACFVVVIVTGSRLAMYGAGAGFAVAGVTAWWARRSVFRMRGAVLIEAEVTPDATRERLRVTIDRLMAALLVLFGIALIVHVSGGREFVDALRERRGR